MNDAIIFKKTQFINNFAKSKSSAFGGAIATQRSTTFENCLFIKNHATAPMINDIIDDSVYGGAIYTVIHGLNNQRLESNMYISNSLSMETIKSATDDKDNVMWGIYH